jgi:myo-inositol-hexaphosphate 3-phosphohydrolase
MRSGVMVGGPAHGTITVIKPPYLLETVTTHSPENRITRHDIAVHPTLLLHRRLPDKSSIIYKANEAALQAYLLDALLRVCDG